MGKDADDDEDTFSDYFSRSDDENSPALQQGQQRGRKRTQRSSIASLSGEGGSGPGDGREQRPRDLTFGPAPGAAAAPPPAPSPRFYFDAPRYAAFIPRSGGGGRGLTPRSGAFLRVSM